MPQVSEAAKSDELDRDLMTSFTMYVPQSDRLPFERSASRLGAEVAFDATRGVYELQAAVTSTIQFEDLVKPYEEGSRGHARWQKEHDRSVGSDERVLQAAKVAGEMAGNAEIIAARDGVRVAENTPPQSRADRDLAYAARSVAAKADGLNFVAQFIKQGFMMASPNGGDRHVAHVKLLSEASPEELREVAARTSQVYSELGTREWMNRFDHAVKNDTFWKGEFAKATRSSDRGKAIFDLRGKFMALPFAKQKAAAPDVGLTDAERAQFTALNRGFNAIKDRYFDLVKEPLNIRISTGAKTEVKAAEPAREATSAIGKAMSRVKERDAGISR